MVSRTTRLAPIASIACAEPDEQPLEVVFAGLLDLAALDADVVEGEQALLLQALQVEAQRGDVGLEVARGLLEAHEEPGSPYFSAPFTRKSMAKTVLPEPAPPATSDAALGQAAVGDLVEALDSGGDLGKR